MIGRKIEDLIKSRLFKGKTLLVFGPRQVGKTTLLNEILKTTDFQGIYLNADLPVVREGLSNAGFEQIGATIGTNKLVVIDEAQRIKNIGLTLKIMHDNFPDVQVLATGSSAFELANDINEPLTGRKIEFKMYPISWAELVENTGYLQALDQLENRMIYGMYPDVINNKGNEEEILTELNTSYLYKDLLSYSGIRKPQILEKLLKALALQLGKEVSLNELGRMLEIDKATVENYLDLLEKAFVIFRLQPFSRNLRNEITSSRKIYFYDNGIRNAIIQNYNGLNLRNDTGALWENFLISERMKKNQYERRIVSNYFWRTHAQQEIDYVEESNCQLEAFEFKWNPKAKTKFPLPFKNEYTPSKSEVIHRGNFNTFL